MLFQSTRPRGARPYRSIKYRGAWLFQSTRPRGARQGLTTEVAGLRDVSIHAPTGGATALPFFFVCAVEVSIHAPTGGATLSRLRHDEIKIVSIHAPTGGATFSGGKDSGVLLFQSTRPRGARRTRTPQGQHQNPVSIHAPTGGATLSRRSRNDPRPFQSTRPRGARHSTCNIFGHIKGFQSTRPRGAQPRRRPGQRSENSFNPRAHGGRDDKKPVAHLHHPEVSIHAPTGGATAPSIHFRYFLMFQFTRPRGARPACSPLSQRLNGFNPRAHGGATSYSRKSNEL